MRSSFSSEPFDPMEPELGTHIEDGHLRPLPVDDEPEEDETPRGGILRAAITLIWILLAVGFSVARACSDGA